MRYSIDCSSMPLSSMLIPGWIFDVHCVQCVIVVRPGAGPTRPTPGGVNHMKA